MGPIFSFGETEKLQKGNTEFTLQSRWDRFALSVRPKSYERETESLHCEIDGTDHSSRLDGNITKGNREFAIPSR